MPLFPRPSLGAEERPVGKLEHPQLSVDRVQVAVVKLADQLVEEQPEPLGPEARPVAFGHLPKVLEHGCKHFEPRRRTAEQEVRTGVAEPDLPHGERRVQRQVVQVLGDPWMVETIADHARRGHPLEDVVHPGQVVLQLSAEVRQILLPFEVDVVVAANELCRQCQVGRGHRWLLLRTRRDFRDAEGQAGRLQLLEMIEVGEVKLDFAIRTWRRSRRDSRRAHGQTLRADRRAQD